MNKYVKEILLWMLIVLPYVYLAIIWNTLPDIVPIHFNLAGNADDWSSKTTLLFLPGALGLGIYLLMLVIPKLDPKRKIQQMGGKYYSLRFILTFFFSVLTIYILYITQAGSLEKPNMLIALIGVLLAIFGNYFQTIRPNYFVGIRTPWTLESEQVWKKTHRLAGPLWIIGGVLIIVISLILQSNSALAIIFGVILFVMVIIPVVYSYTEFQKEKRAESIPKQG